MTSADRILVLSHLKPDGDAVGSMLGLGIALRRIGKTVELAVDDGVPEPYRFLPQSGTVQSALSGLQDLTIAVDTSDRGRLGKVGVALARPVDINIDHHVTNPGFARLNFVDPRMTATAEYVLRLLEPLGLSLDAEVAECLLTGLVSDTLGFRTSNMTPEALGAAQVLMRAGADLPKVYDRSLNSRSFHAVRFWGEGLANMKLDGRIVWTSLSLAARKESGYRGTGDADLINVLTTVREADVALIFVEQEPNLIKISWRAAPGIDVTPIAKSFGGGGHPAASGAEVVGSLDDVSRRVIAATKAALNGKRIG